MDRESSVRTETPARRRWACALPAGDTAGPGRWVASYIRVVEHLTRGWVAVVLTAGSFALGGVLPERVGLAVASAWVLFLGTYCVLNFWHCRETHCVVTGWGWTPLGALGLTAAMGPARLSWFDVTMESAAFVVILGAAYALEAVVAARTGRRALR